MNIKLRYKLLIASGLLLAAFLYGRFHKSKPTPGPLPVNDTNRVVVDPVHHSITVVTPTGTHTTTLPDRVSVIDVHHDGSIVVTAKQFGYECRPFAGIFYSDGLRYGAGIDGLYFKKLDLGFGLAGASGLNTVAFVKISYTVWDNVSLGLTYDHMQHIGGSITLRI